MAYALLFRYELWKLRCGRVVEAEQPTERRAMQETIVKLRSREMDVSASDRRLFEKRNAPKEGDSLDRMRQWIRSVENLILRRERFEIENHKKIREYLKERTSNDGGT